MKLAHWATEERMGQLPVRCALEAGTIVCLVPAAVLGGTCSAPAPLRTPLEPPRRLVRLEPLAC